MGLNVETLTFVSTIRFSLSFGYVVVGQNVPKIDGKIQEPSSNSKVMSLHVQVYKKMIDFKTVIYF